MFDLDDSDLASDDPDATAPHEPFEGDNAFDEAATDALLDLEDALARVAAAGGQFTHNGFLLPWLSAAAVTHAQVLDVLIERDPPQPPNGGFPIDLRPRF